MRLLGFAVAVAVGLALLSWQRLDGMYYDELVRAWYRWAGARPAVDIVLAVIDEAALADTDRPLAQWQPQLAAALDLVARGGARVVGLDVVLTEKPAINPQGASLDLPLMAALARHQARMPVVLAQTATLAPNDGKAQLRPLQSAYVEIVGPERVGSVLLPLDDDGTARRLPNPDAMPFSLKIARAIEPAAGTAGTKGLIDYRLGAPLSIVPLRDVFTNTHDDGWLRSRFAGRTVLIGAGVLDDRLIVPRDPADGWGRPPRGTALGVAVQAQAVRSWLAPPLQHAALTWPVLLTLLASAVGFVGARGRVTQIWIYAAISAIALALCSAVAFAFDYVVPVVGAMAAALVAAAAASAYSAWRGWQERSRVAQVFGGYVSPGVFQKLLAGEIDTRTRRLQDCAFLFADIRNFTAVTELIGPARALEFLNLYYAHATEIIHSAGGTIESFRGDGLAAFFGAPQPLDGAAEAALKAARDLLLRLPALNRTLEADALPLIDIGIGLSKGTGIAGHVGSADRYHYSVIGTATNLAARLQELCKLLGVGLIASPEFVRATSAPWRSLGVQPIKGVGDLEVFTLDA